MKLKLFPVIITAAITSLITFFLFAKFQDKLPFAVEATNSMPVNYANYKLVGAQGVPPADFEQIASASVQAVVHVKTQTKGRTVIAKSDDDFLNQFFGPQQYYLPPQTGSGSGVVVSPDGYIVTNYHVVTNADKVTVTFNDRYTTEAKVIAKDAATDIALLKVADKGLPYIEFGNSDNVRLGQWVLAVGYPLTLDATVTAGIVSAKSRSIGVNRTQSASAIESFIQTDAAVNPGNSGGALMNTQGQLIGINSAIASPTGYYTGYSYAIPANLVKKVIDDLKQFGTVQRAYLGVQLMRQQDKTAINNKRNSGVYVADAPINGGAYQAGIRKNDYITRVNDVTVNSEPELLEQVARFKPGDNVSVTYNRDGKEYNTTVLLKNVNGTTAVLKGQTASISEVLGAAMRPLSLEEKNRYGAENGVLVTKIARGVLSQQTTMKNGFVILKANDQEVNSADDIQQVIAENGSVKLGGFYPGNNGMYYYGIRVDPSLFAE
ncbi:MAG TPA: trypsin-like peptidase domain-containing protein [Flavipsychrobacter sp.]|nr:trypsin-like peptidase domain-containing protein [Flavipsychrobacter sp.]